MEAVSARINSFKKSKRVKNPDKPSSSATLKWPHPPDFKANPETLAEAGFYYDPAYGDPDNVTCYVCEKELGGWEEDDDPLLLHWTKCGQQCCWASVRCGLAVDLDKSGRFISSDKTRIPTHKSMEKARLETFNVGKGWIHDKVKGHGASSVMMARAGFVYTPQHSEDDLAACLYCGTSLSGWDAEDNPLEEHRTRAARLDSPCLFFSTSKPPTKSQSKPPSRSASKSNHQDVVLPTKTFDGEGEDSDTAETAKPTKSTAKTPRKPRSTSSTTRKSTAKTPKPKARSTSRSELKGVAEDVEEEPETEVPVTVKKKAPSRSKSIVQPEVQSEDDEGIETQVPATVKKKPPSRSKPASKVQSIVDPEEEKTEPPPTTKKKPKPKPKNSTVKSDLEPEAESETAEAQKPSRSKTRKVMQESADEDAEDVPRKSSRAKSKTTAPVEVEEVSRKVSRVKAKPSNDIPVSDEEPPRKQSRSKSKPKAPDSEHEDIAKVTDTEPPPPTKLKHQRTASKSKSKASTVISRAEPAEQEEQPARAVPKKKTSSKSKPSQPLVAEDLFDEGAATEVQTPPSPPPVSRQPSTAEMALLFVPKRNTADAPSSSQPSEQTMKAVPKSKPQPHKPMKVVEISSDEESDDDSNQGQQAKNVAHTFPQPQFSTPPRPTSSQSHPRKPVIVETMQPTEVPRSDSPAVVESNNDDDVNMQDIDQDIDDRMDDMPPPSTPPRSTVQSVRANAVNPANESQPVPAPPAQNPVAPSEPPFVPPLSKLPFAPIQSLADAELDMTVEEWIRYQMDVEFDKFRRDGERELQQFRKKAEDVRKIIEGL